MARAVLMRIIERHGRDVTIVHGGGPGVDNSFSQAARQLGLIVEPHLAQLHNMDAGAARHVAMINAGADLCLAIHSSLATSERTKDCARKAIAAGIPTYLIVADDGIPRRLRADDVRLE
jgi:hypothetical protein